MKMFETRRTVARGERLALQLHYPPRDRSSPRGPACVRAAGSAATLAERPPRAGSTHQLAPPRVAVRDVRRVSEHAVPADGDPAALAPAIGLRSQRAPASQNTALRVQSVVVQQYPLSLCACPGPSFCSNTAT